MSTTVYVPDPFITWILKWTIRSLALSIAVGVVAGVLSIVFRIVGTMVDTLHSALHACLLFWISLVHVYQQTGYVGQWILICLIFLGLLYVLSRMALFVYQAFFQGRTVS